LSSRPQAIARTCFAGSQRSYCNGFAGAFRSLHERDSRLHLNAVPYKNFLLLKWISSARPPSSPASEASKEILEIEIGSKPTSRKATSSERSSSGTTKRVSAWIRSWPWTSTLIKSCRAKLIPGSLFLWIRQKLVCRLRFCKFFFSCWILVGIRMVFLRKSIICLLDICCRGAFVDPEDGVRVLRCLKICR
jgi:hypothetical protein